MNIPTSDCCPRHPPHLLTLVVVWNKTCTERGSCDCSQRRHTSQTLPSRSYPTSTALPATFHLTHSTRTRPTSFNIPTPPFHLPLFPLPSPSPSIPPPPPLPPSPSPPSPSSHSLFTHSFFSPLDIFPNPLPRCRLVLDMKRC